jgi:hypothetical protein
MGTLPRIPRHQKLRTLLLCSTVIQLHQSLQRTRILLCHRRARHSLNTMVHPRQRLRTQCNHTLRLDIIHNIKLRMNHGSTSRFELTPLPSVVNRLPTSTIADRRPKPSAVHHITKTWSWCNIIPCATIRHCKNVLFLYLFMSSFQRLSLICVTALEKGKSVFCRGYPVLTTLTSRQQGRREGRNMYTQMYTGGQFWHLLPYSCFFKRTIPAKQIHSHRLLYCNRSEIMAMSYLEGSSRASVRVNAKITHQSSRIVLCPQLTTIE